MMTPVLRRAALRGLTVAVLALASACATPRSSTALAQLQVLNAELLRNDSATATLERWCDQQQLAPVARIVAERVAGSEVPPTPAQRALLQVSDAEPVRHRRVRLRCGTAVLSEADNWYVPARLTADMNRQLDATDTPFGRVVQALQFRRRTLDADTMWQGRGVPPRTVLRHRAVLSLPQGLPISLVVENYTREVLPARR